MDLGSSGGHRFHEIKTLFKPKSYTGIDMDPKAPKMGERRMLNIQKLDFLRDDVSGDLGVMFGTHQSPKGVQILGQHFNLLVFNDFAENKLELQKQREAYANVLGGENFDQILDLPRPLIASAGLGIESYYFYRPKHDHLSRGQRAQGR